MNPLPAGPRRVAVTQDWRIVPMIPSMLRTPAVLAVALLLNASAAPAPPAPPRRSPSATASRSAAKAAGTVLAVDAPRHRLYVTHGTRVVVVDVRTDSVVGEIPNTPGVHGVALAPDLGRGFTSNGRDSSVTVFDLRDARRARDREAPGPQPRRDHLRPGVAPGVRVQRRQRQRDRARRPHERGRGHRAARRQARVRRGGRRRAASS